MAETEGKTFFNMHDGIRGRDGGPYLDMEEAVQAEIRRARAEGREPDLENPPPTVGQPYVLAHEVTDNIPSNPSMGHLTNPLADALHDAKVKAAEDNPNTSVPVTLQVDTRTALPDSERDAQRDDIAELAKDPSNVATTSYKNVSDEPSKPAAKKATAKKAAAKRTAKKR
jgi:hypothetical protein